MSNSSAQKAPIRQELSGVLIEHTAKRMKHAFSKILTEKFESKITVDQWVVLYEIYKNESMSQLELGEAVYKDAPTITRIIDLLVAKNFINRNSDELDRRKFSISLTENGHDLVKEIIPSLKKFREACYSNISKNELILLEKVLNKIKINLQ
jgi:DNA-binding MarR family transcriptional regulator